MSFLCKRERQHLFIQFLILHMYFQLYLFADLQGSFNISEYSKKYHKCAFLTVIGLANSVTGAMQMMFSKRF